MPDVAEGIHFRFSFLVEIDPLSFDSPRSWEGCNEKKKLKLSNTFHDKNSSEKRSLPGLAFNCCVADPGFTSDAFVFIPCG